MATSVKSAKLYKEKDNYYIDVSYLYEDDRVIKELNIPKIALPLTTYSQLVIDAAWDHDDFLTDMRGMRMYDFPVRTVRYLRIGSDGCRLRIYGKEGIYYTEKIIKEKTQEMTIEEIEKKLGHKIKIVGKK